MSTPKSITDVALHNFLVDVATTFVESRPYSWFDVEDYEWYDPTLSSGTAPPVTIGGTVAQNVVGRVRVADPDKDEGSWKSWHKLTPHLVARGFATIEAGPVDGLSEKYRAHILGALAIRDAGMIDANDADVVMQVAMLGSVVYA